MASEEGEFVVAYRTGVVNVVYDRPGAVFQGSRVADDAAHVDRVDARGVGYSGRAQSAEVVRTGHRAFVHVSGYSADAHEAADAAGVVGVAYRRVCAVGVRLVAAEKLQRACSFRIIIKQI